MTRVRTVLPTDLVALVAYDGRVYPNESVTRDRAGTTASPHPLEAALEQWFSFATGRHTWISVKGATLRGLVSARRRGTRAAWEVDCLIDAAEDDTNVLISLLNKVAADAGRTGAQKVFLRIAAESPVLQTACASGFSSYNRERLLVLHTDDRAPSSGPEPAGLRRWARGDAYRAYQLYNRWTPEPVRHIEAATFAEWQAAGERVSPPRGTHQRVVERDGRIAGWLRTAAVGDVGRFDLMADPSDTGLLDSLIDAALTRLRDQALLLTLVPSFAGGLRERLLDRGFEEREEYVVLARRTAQPVPARAPELAPAAPATLA